MRGDALTGVLHLALGQPHVAQRLGPHRPLQATHHGAEQLLGRGHTQDHADALPVQLLELTGRCVFEHAPRHDQGQQLGGVGGGHDGRWHTPGYRVEIDCRNESATLGVGLVRRARVGVVIVLDQPMVGRNVGDQVGARENVPPEAGLVDRARKQGANTNDSNGLGGIVSHGCLTR